MDQVVLQTYANYDDDADVMYEYQIVKEENKKTEDTEYVVYRFTGIMRFRVVGRYDYFLDAVKALHTHMENEIVEED